jgi:very-short-patch-repair endonuclease
MRRRQLTIARSRQLAERAAQMRSHLNPAEAALWALLQRRQLGVVFRRQVVVLGRYIADFLAPSVKLIVEVDGGYHVRRVSADAGRDEALRRVGYRVVRLEAEAVLRRPEEACLAICARLQA